jgi:glucosamine-6-phosphate deaminase
VNAIAIRRVDDYDDLSRVAAVAIAEVIRAVPAARILVATGGTPMGAYRELAEMTDAREVDASGTTAFQLDEYLGLEPGDRRSLGRWALETFVRPLRIDDDRFVRLPVDGAPGLAAYDHRVQDDGGYDMAILGIGENGHLGFNEPPSDADAPTRVVELSESSLRSNARYWDTDAGVPDRAVTVGLGPILGSRRIVLLASGAGKRAILHRALSEPPTPEVPASFLQRAGSVLVVADRAAAPGAERDGDDR